MAKGKLTLLGFILFILGFSAICLMVVGVQLSFLTWMDYFGKLPGFLMRLLMIIAGIMLVVLDNTNFKK